MENTGDFERAGLATNCPVQLCPVKWEAAKLAIEHARIESPKIARLLEQVGLTPDFVPSPANSKVQSPKPASNLQKDFYQGMTTPGIAA